ncbi:MAG: rpiA [Parachlamydiales bacterium]|nr:rpiA [Parachlamydiales bacterium]
MSIEDAKKAVGKAAADLIQNDMIVGLGTGSTANYFIEALSVRARNNLFLKAVVPSSQRSHILAKRLGLPVQELNDVPYVDITVDGADEIDPLKRMIKGGGGAHVREKILAANSREMIVIVDESKLVPAVGVGKLPVEILPYGSPATRSNLEKLGYLGKWRIQEDGSFFITENDNLIYDVVFSAPPPYPQQDHEQIRLVPGVIDTGFFFNIAGRVIVGYNNGRIEIH